MKKITLGILAHADAGKTTLSEALLYTAGSIRTLGRVDHGDSFLDSGELERERGITIRAKQAVLELPDTRITLLDTPGHTDFSAEAERTLQVLDAAILVVSASEGVQAHTETLWNLLKKNRVPVFLFLNKADLPNADIPKTLEVIRRRLDDRCLLFRGEPDPEELALCDESLLGAYTEGGTLTDDAVAESVAARHVFPCWYGSALKLDGVEEFLRGVVRFAPRPHYTENFSARVFQIARDPQGNRLTFCKLGGGALRVRTALTGRTPDGGTWTEKVEQIRLYSGTKFTQLDTAEAGDVCALTGLTHTVPGEGLGEWAGSYIPPTLEPVLASQVLLPEDCDPNRALACLRELEEEDPTLRVVWDADTREIRLQLMGEVQVEVLQEELRRRFGLEVTFGPAGIVYRETIRNTAEGVGHFEPLRHYAEVHLLLEPGAPGSGLVLRSDVSSDRLAVNWQHLVLSCLAEGEIPGVLTGAPVTDMKITLTDGRASMKHTEGGDFRQATLRAVRQGLMSAESVLLEPWYAFQLKVPEANIGRAMNDLEQMGGEFGAPETADGEAALSGRAPVAGLRYYPAELRSYTGGRFSLSCEFCGFLPCRNADEVIAEKGYRPESDLRWTPDSVFCKKGAAVTVSWRDVPAHMDLPPYFRETGGAEDEDTQGPRRATAYTGTAEQDKELQAIFERTYGPIRERSFRKEIPKAAASELPEHMEASTDAAEEYLLVDGYNIIFAWDDLKELAAENIGAARLALTDILKNYQAYRGCRLILVFDAYRVRGGRGSVESDGNGFTIVYTKEAETADAYIEKATYELGRNSRVRVATSDALEQLIILGHGSQRISARTFRDEVLSTSSEIRSELQRQNLSKTGPAPDPKLQKLYEKLLREHGEENHSDT